MEIHYSKAAKRLGAQVMVHMLSRTDLPQDITVHMFTGLSNLPSGCRLLWMIVCGLPRMLL